MIFRSEHKKEFVRVAWSTVKDERLTLEARGFLVFLLSLPDNWEFSIGGLASMTGLPRSAIMRLARDLKDAGYLVQKKRKNKQGHFCGCEWNIYETPEVDKNRTTEQPNYGKTEVRQHRSAASPKCGKSRVIQDDIYIQDEIYIQNEIKEKKAEPFAELLEPLSPELKKVYRDFIKMRKTIKAPLTDKALELVIKKAHKLANGDENGIKEIVEQSIANSWRGVFPVKDKPVTHCQPKEQPDPVIDWDELYKRAEEADRRKGNT